MSSDSATLFSKYATILQKNRHRQGLASDRNQASDQENENENERGLGSTFNQSFEDVQEIQQDGNTLTVIRTGSVFRREAERRGRFDEFSLLLRRKTDIKSQAQPELQLEIQSDSLRRAFVRLAGNLTTINLKHDPIVIPEPFMEIYHTRRKIQQAVEEAVDDNSLQAELQLLIDFERQYMAKTIKTIDSFMQNGHIEFEWLWALFPPGELVVIENRSAASAPIHWCAYAKTFEIYKVSNDTSIWSITVTHTGFNGTRLGTTETTLGFPSFTNNVPITSLGAYPLRYAKDADSITRESIRRGREYERYCLASSGQMKKPVGTPLWHDGPIWTEREENSEDRRGCRIIDYPSRTVKSRVIVDFEGFFRNFPAFRESFDLENDIDESYEDDDLDSYGGRTSRRPSRISTDDSLLEACEPLTPTLPSEKNLLTCPPLVPVFALSTCEWCLVFIDDLEEIKWNPDAINQLQVDAGRKEAIQGLVQGSSTHGTGFDDFIAGKGCGLVFLLHGPPGCGKTMTAESISEFLRKPLYHVTGSELGSTAFSIRNALTSAFDLAARWDAIILLDEADSFLAKRDGADVVRNSIIAVFLRLIEYQTGIIFLTTNRLSDFDEAFESRIHLQISFPPLDGPKRRLIWKHLAQDNGNCILSEEQIGELGELSVDGRRIKNVLRLASLFAANRIRDQEAKEDGQAVAVHDAVRPAMTFEDIKKVLPLVLEPKK